MDMNVKKGSAKSIIPIRIQPVLFIVSPDCFIDEEVIDFLVFIVNGANIGRFKDSHCTAERYRSYPDGIRDSSDMTGRYLSYLDGIRDSSDMTGRYLSYPDDPCALRYHTDVPDFRFLSCQLGYIVNGVKFENISKFAA